MNSTLVILLALITTGLVPALFLSSVSETGRQDKAPATQESAVIKPSGLDTAAQMKQCKKCHMDTFEEWEQSRHGKSWSNPVFQAAIKDEPDKGEACARCHAPDSVLITGPGKLPLARGDSRELGVNCVTCHMDGKKYFGPHASKGHGGVVVLEEYRQATWCVSCHGQPEVNKAHDQYTSYKLTEAGQDGKSCQKCHMPYVERPLVKSKEKLRDVQGPMDCREHLFQGAWTREVVESAATLTVTFAGDAQVEVVIEVDTGHSFPASEGREVRLLVELLDGAGKTVGSHRKVWDMKTGKVMMPGTPDKTTLPVKPEVKRVTCRLDLVFQVVPGRTEERITMVTSGEATR